MYFRLHWRWYSVNINRWTGDYWKNNQVNLVLAKRKWKFVIEFLKYNLLHSWSNTIPSHYNIVCIFCVCAFRCKAHVLWWILIYEGPIPSYKVFFLIIKFQWNRVESFVGWNTKKPKILCDLFNSAQKNISNFYTYTNHRTNINYKDTSEAYLKCYLWIYLLQ